MKEKWRERRERGRKNNVLECGRDRFQRYGGLGIFREIRFYWKQQEIKIKRMKQQIFARSEGRGDLWGTECSRENSELVGNGVKEECRERRKRGRNK